MRPGPRAVRLLVAAGALACFAVAIGPRPGSPAPLSRGFVFGVGHLDVCEALPGLYLGGAPSGSARRRIARRCGITRVLDLRTPGEGPAGGWPAGVIVRSAPIPDRMCPDAALLADLVDWTRHELGTGRRVLVHCLVGQGRAPTIVLGVLVRMGYSLSEAHRLLLERRPVIAPTDAQLEGLRAYEHSHHEVGCSATSG